MRAGLAREPVGMLLHAGDVDPQPLTAADLLACVPYYAEASFTVPMQRLAAGGWLEAAGSPPAGQGAYRLTEKGRAATDSMYAAARSRLAALTPLPAADLERLAQLLRQLLDACQANPLVTDQSCLAASGNATEWAEPAPIATIARVLEALTNGRCDAHRAAWRLSGLDGVTWEVLTWLWEGRAKSAASLYDWSARQPHPRAWTASDYAACLAILEQRGLAMPTGGECFALSEPGRALRQTVEDQTDANFFAAWAALTPAEIDELAAHAQATIDGLKP